LVVFVFFFFLSRPSPSPPPPAALFHNDHGRFVDVSAGSGADLAIRGTGCAAADLDRDGDTDLVVGAAGTPALLWNDGDGTFTEGARDAGLAAYGWYSGVAIGDVNGDGWQDVFLAGYANLNAPNAQATGGFPRTFAGVRDLLFVNAGLRDGRAAFREVGAEVGLETAFPAHGLGATFSDLDGDGDLDLVVANDLDPNALYENVAWPDGAAADPLGLGFRFDEVAAPAGVADPNAGMGVAIDDVNRDGLADLFVTNARQQGHATYLGAPSPIADLGFAPLALDVPSLLRSTAFGVSFGDLDRDGLPDALLVNGDVPVRDLRQDAEPIRFLRNLGGDGTVAFAEEGASVGLDAVGRFVARGSALADFDNDGDLDVAIATVGGPLVLLRAAGGAAGWLEVAPWPATPGTRVSVTADGATRTCELRAGSSYQSSEDPRCLFGLGLPGLRATVTVTWPDGTTRTLDDVAAERILAVGVV
ncbi:MAG: CRTAC1 family protein, partial [Actinomycetota bacterium]